MLELARRTHKKSRYGRECKRRHVKCDERQPICSNCTIAGLVCGYGSRLLNATRRTPLPGARAHSAPTSPAPCGIPLVRPAGYQPVNILHFELFHNLYTQIRTTRDPNRSIAWLADDVAYLVTTPYLINQLLAFSALHLSITRLNRRRYYCHYTAQLQT